MTCEFSKDWSDVATFAYELFNQFSLQKCVCLPLIRSSSSKRAKSSAEAATENDLKFNYSKRKWFINCDWLQREGNVLSFHSYIDHLIFLDVRSSRTSGRTHLYAHIGRSSCGEGRNTCGFIQDIHIIFFRGRFHRRSSVCSFAWSSCWGRGWKLAVILTNTLIKVYS